MVFGPSFTGAGALDDATHLHQVAGLTGYLPGLPLVEVISLMRANRLFMTILLARAGVTMCFPLRRFDFVCDGTSVFAGFHGFAKP